MEYEVRFYYPSEEIREVLEMVGRQSGLDKHERSYEKTMQFDHPCEKMSFYSKEIDGRFRVRVTESKEGDSCRISWKRRIPTTTSEEVNKEEEVEIAIRYDEHVKLKFIIEKVLKMKMVESYERYRTRFANEEVEIVVDEYPFGVALEVENKSSERDPVEVVKKWVEKLGLDISKAYRKSWDDKYAELCAEQGIEKYDHVEFGRPMPGVIPLI